MAQQLPGDRQAAGRVRGERTQHQAGRPEAEQAQPGGSPGLGQAVRQHALGQQGVLAPTHRPVDEQLVGAGGEQRRREQPQVAGELRRARPCGQRAAHRWNAQGQYTDDGEVGREAADQQVQRGHLVVGQRHGQLVAQGSDHVQDRHQRDEHAAQPELGRRIDAAEHRGEHEDQGLPGDRRTIGRGW